MTDITLTLTFTEANQVIASLVTVAPDLSHEDSAEALAQLSHDERSRGPSPTRRAQDA